MQAEHHSYHFYKMSQTMQAPPPTTSTKTAAAPASSPVNRRTLTREVAANLSNNAARLYADREYADALMLYKQSISLLNEMTLGSQDNMQNAAFRNLSEIADFTQTIEIPLDSAYDCEVRPCSDGFVSVAVMYNIFLLLRKTGQTIEAFRLLEVVHSVTEAAGPHAGDWHSTFKLAIQYHLATLAYECGASDESWQFFIQAIEMGRTHLSHHMLYATVCTHMGGRLLEARYYDEAQAVYQEAIAIYEHFSTEEIDLHDASSGAFAAAAA
jgi:tetratricopeptide (TPR) repeat protein